MSQFGTKTSSTSYERKRLKRDTKQIVKVRTIYLTLANFLDQFLHCFAKFCKNICQNICMGMKTRGGGSCVKAARCYELRGNWMMPWGGEEWITRPVASHSRRGIENEQKYREPFKAHLSSRRRQGSSLEGSLAIFRSSVSNFPILQRSFHPSKNGRKVLRKRRTVFFTFPFLLQSW